MKSVGTLPSLQTSGFLDEDLQRFLSFFLFLICTSLTLFLFSLILAFPSDSFPAFFLNCHSASPIVLFLSRMVICVIKVCQIGNVSEMKSTTTTSTVSVRVFVVIKFIVEIKEMVQFVNCKDIIYGNILYITYCTGFWCSVYYYNIKVVANVRYFKRFFLFQTNKEVRTYQTKKSFIRNQSFDNE